MGPQVSSGWPNTPLVLLRERDGCFFCASAFLYLSKYLRCYVNHFTLESRVISELQLGWCTSKWCHMVYPSSSCPLGQAHTVHPATAGQNIWTNSRVQKWMRRPHSLSYGGNNTSWSWPEGSGIIFALWEFRGSSNTSITSSCCHRTKWLTFCHHAMPGSRAVGLWLPAALLLKAKVCYCGSREQQWEMRPAGWNDCRS